MLALFDKSFLESLSLNDIKLYDRLFKSIICSTFYIETICDLTKSRKNQPNGKELVKRIANKVTYLNSISCPYYIDLCISDLLGNKVPMIGQVPKYKSKIKDEEYQYCIPTTPRINDFFRWSNSIFKPEEYKFVEDYQKHLSDLNLDSTTQRLKKLGIDGRSCKSLKEIINLVNSFSNRWDNSSDRFDSMLAHVGVPMELFDIIRHGWVASGYQSISIFSPYAAHVFRVETFFEIARASGLITLALSSLMDIRYLHYLPFCNVFISSDYGTHGRFSRYFMRYNQEFIRGEDIKNRFKDSV